MKKALFMSFVALVCSVVALVKVFMPCGKGGASLSADEVQKILNDNPTMVVNAMQNYEQQMRKQMEDEANAMIQGRIEDLNNYDKDLSEGSADADVVLVEFYDYACGYCHRLYPEMEKIVAANKDIKIVYKPLAFVSQYSDYAGRAVLAAKKQGKFKELHNALFSAEEALSEEMIERTAQSVGLDVAQLKTDAESEEISQIMSFNNELAGNIQVGGVPTMVLNGELLQTLDAAVIQEKINALK